MPQEHRNLYVSTTLMIVIFTTIICGGLTEPMLTYTAMRVEKVELSDDGSEHRTLISSHGKEESQRGGDADRNLPGLFNRAALVGNKNGHESKSSESPHEVSYLLLALQCLSLIFIYYKYHRWDMPQIQRVMTKMKQIELKVLR